ncbi:hypothetical protein LOAG_03242 [Loa loa]|uniref:Uncharacterized protein n=1 Tax=Loa loa TaxID=7209 RepID=A0A1S0U535_LOALO|nr:hypothetical protein LOAG_03242 [Loa loa]EFO25242.1 hypothetical protein LOAG_03242 [Loa loa]
MLDENPETTNIRVTMTLIPQLSGGNYQPVQRIGWKKTETVRRRSIRIQSRVDNRSFTLSIFRQFSSFRFSFICSSFRSSLNGRHWNNSAQQRSIYSSLFGDCCRHSCNRHYCCICMDICIHRVTLHATVISEESP